MSTFNLDNLNLFSNALKTLSMDHKTYYYIPYFISSPIYIYKENKKNDAFLPLYILVLDKKNPKNFYIETTHINWHSIHYYQTFTYILNNNSARKLESIPNYSKYFKEESIEINPTNTKLKSLKELMADGFYKNLTSVMNKKLENEVFIEFESNKRKYLISGIELVRYFYAKAEEDSLLNVLFHIQGINLLYNDLTTSSTEYKLYLKNDCSKVDAIHALYFIHEDKFSEYFNEIFLRMKEEEYLYASFPSSKTFNINCRTFIHDDVSLIIKITDSTIHDKLSDRKIKITHPNDKEIDKRNFTKSKTKPIKTETTPENELDNEISSISTADELTVIENESSSLKKKELEVEFEKDKTEKKQPKNGILIKKNEETKITPNNGDGIKKEGTKSQLRTILYPNEFEEVLEIDYFNSIDKIIKIFKDLYSFNIIDKSFYFPDKKNSNGKQKKVSISFVDKKRLQRRRYILIRFESKKEGVFFFLDVEEKEKNQKKEILIIKKDLEIMDCQKKYITKIIYDQVKEGNHKWLSKNTHGLLNSEIKTFGHGQSNKIGELCKRIYNYIST